jgi:hypothetical protein
LKRCPTCGLTLDDSQAFCTNDGTPLPSNQTRDQQATMVNPPGGYTTAQPPTAQPQGAQTNWQTAPHPTAPPVYTPQQQQPYAQRQPYYGQMPTAQPSKLVPGLIGGVIAGILSTFADFMSPDVFVIFSFFCILWALIGGAIASMFYIKRSPTPVRTGEGAVVGLIAGAVGAVLYLAVATPIAYAIHGDYIQMVASQQPEKITAGTFFALTGVAGAVTIFAFSVIGGLIGVPIFEKRKAAQMGVPPPPPPMPDYGAPPGGYR